jgi:hypothetical protein
VIALTDKGKKYFPFLKLSKYNTQEHYCNILIMLRYPYSETEELTTQQLLVNSALYVKLNTNRFTWHLLTRSTGGSYRWE